MKKGQSALTIILSVASVFASAGGIGYLYNDVSRANIVNAEQGEDIATIQEAIKCIPEMKNDIRETRDNMIKLMASQGVNPVTRILATSTDAINAGK
jgi:hypothetical protein